MSEQVWSWLYEPLLLLREAVKDEPAVPWEDRLPWFLERLGVSSVDEHPVLWQLHEHMASLTHEEQNEFLLGSELEAVVYDWVVRLTTEPEPASEEVPATADEIAELVVSRIALPVLIELSVSRPDLLAAANLNQTLSRVLAERLRVA